MYVKATGSGLFTLSRKYGIIRVRAAETPKYAKKQTRSDATIPRGIDF